MTAEEYLQDQHPHLKENWDKHDVINDLWIAEQMEDYHKSKAKEQEEARKIVREHMDCSVEWEYPLSDRLESYYVDIERIDFQTREEAEEFIEALRALCT